MWIRASETARSWNSAAHRLVDEVGERAGELDAGGSAADDDEVQRALVDQRRVTVGVLEHADDARSQPLGVIEAVERERVLRGARGAEEVRLRARREHDRVAGERPPVRGGHAACHGVQRLDRAQLDVDVRVVREHLAQREGDVARRQLRGRDLVQQGLELVVVVAVEQRDVHVVVAREPAGAADAGEAAAHHDDVELIRHVRPPCATWSRRADRADGRPPAARWPSRSAPG